MPEYLLTARWGLPHSTFLRRRRLPLSLRQVVGAAPILCAAPVARSYNSMAPVRACSTRARWCYRLNGGLIIPLCTTHARAAERTGEVVAVRATPGICRVCGCTDDDCRGCIERTGEPCYWVEEDLCSACAGEEEADDA